MQSLQDVRRWWQWRNRSGWDVKNYPGWALKGFSLNYLNLLNLINEGHLRHAGAGLCQTGWHRRGKIKKYICEVFFSHVFSFNVSMYYLLSGWTKTMMGHWQRKSFWKDVCKMMNFRRCWLQTCRVKTCWIFIEHFWIKRQDKKRVSGA